MADAASVAKMKALAQYFRNGGSAGTNSTDQFDDHPPGSPTGDISAAPPAGMPPVQNVPQWALHDSSAPEGQSGAGTMDQMAAVRAAQLQQNNLASQPQQPEPDLSGYSAYKGPMPMANAQKILQHQADQDAADEASPNKFQNLKLKISPTQALTPEQESMINQQLSGDDEDDNDSTYPTKTRQFSTPNT